MILLAPDFMATATAVARIGSCAADIAALSDSALEQAQRDYAAHERQLKTVGACLAGEIARRSTFEQGYAGLARRNGHTTPEAFISGITGTKTEDVRELVRVGEMVITHETASAAAEELGIDLATATSEELQAVPALEFVGPEAIWQAPVMEALAHGLLDAAAADAIRKGLGVVDDAVTAEQLRACATQLISVIRTEAENGTPIGPERILKQARLQRTGIDNAAVERGAKTRFSQRSVRLFKEKDGMCGGAWRLPVEEGGAEIDRFFTELISPRLGGPRFTSSDEKAAAQSIIDDPRSNEQILADGFCDLFRFGTGSVAPATLRPVVDPLVDPVETPEGASAAGDSAATAEPSRLGPAFQAPSRQRRRSVVAIVVERTTPNTRTSAPSAGSASGAVEGVATSHCFVPGVETPLPIELAERALCTDDAVEVGVDAHGRVLDFGRTKRLFTDVQRLALSVTWGGCAWPGCGKGAEFAEAHHIKAWDRDKGASDLDNGICLCRFHHMMLHSNHWDITRDAYLCWLVPPRDIDPLQTPIALYSKNPVIRVKQERAMQGHRARDRDGHDDGDHVVGSSGSGGEPSTAA